MIEKFLVEQISSFFSNGNSKSTQSGGGVKPSVKGDPMLVLAILIIFLLIRAYVLQLSYNYIVPRLMYKYQASEQQQPVNPVREITFMEALILLIFTNTLIGH